MGRCILTTGRIAEKPYRIRVIDRNVYTVEELCYSIAQCASFLDEDFMDHELLVWLEESCGLAELASQLRSRNGALPQETERGEIRGFQRTYHPGHRADGRDRG